MKKRVVAKAQKRRRRNRLKYFDKITKAQIASTVKQVENLEIRMSAKQLRRQAIKRAKEARGDEG